VRDAAVGFVEDGRHPLARQDDAVDVTDDNVSGADL
jgi:hypothetical protein